MLYLKNGDVYLGNNYSRQEALKILKERGYKKFYSGRHYQDNKKVIVGIDKNNKVKIAERRKNGLLYAREIRI
jgi:hypothetical protein